MQSRGFSFIELIIVMATIALLASLVTLNLFRSQRSSILTQVTGTLLSDLQSQQTKAMSGVAVGGNSAPGYGIYFSGDRYVLFAGSSYNASDPKNAVIRLESPASIISIGFPGNTVIFASKSGEVAGYVQGSDSVTVDGGIGQTKTIRINRYGVVTVFQ